MTVKKGELDGADFVEAWVGFVLWVNEVFDFGHGELTDAEETCAWRDLVTEGATDLGGGEGDATVVELEQTREVEEMALCSFRAKVAVVLCTNRTKSEGKKNGSDCAYAPRVLTGRPDATCEHEIELLWLPDFVIGIGIPDVVLSAKFTELWARIVVELHGKNCQFYATPT